MLSAKTMSDEAWTDRLVLALLHRDVDGRRIVEIVSEIETHLAASGGDPRDEFGEPGQLADTLAGRTGPSRRTQADLAVFVVISCLASLAIFGLLHLGEDGAVVVTLPVLGASAALIPLMTLLMVYLVRSAGPVFDGKRTPRPHLNTIAWFAVIVASGAIAVALPDVALFELPAPVMWLALSLCVAYVAIVSIKQRRHRKMSAAGDSPPHVLEMVRRWTGPNSWKTGMALGREVKRAAHRRPDRH